MTLADAGDGLDDGNFETEFANAMILKLTTFEKWIQDNINAIIPSGSVDFKQEKSKQDLWDTILENSINGSIQETTAQYQDMKYK